MKSIAVSIRNRVFSESVLLMLKQTGALQPIQIPTQPPEMIIIECRAAKPDILLMDITPVSCDTALEGRLMMIDQLKKELPDCRYALLCDETAYPEAARNVMRAKQRGQIDAFFYASVTAEYLTASLEAL
ncbi:MAG: hypothetical protein MRZ59_11320 [Clostridiales bacterium]|nr:hypothetical protein [Clostridiales bacterium]MDY3747404.1 hypothetical protein [Lachnospiraceae bacterium]